MVEHAIEGSRLERDLSGSVEELLAELAELTEATRASRDIESERRLLWLRNLAGLRLVAEPGIDPRFPSPNVRGLPSTDGLPDFAPADANPSLLRAAILRDGCMIVRNLVDRDDACRFAAQIDRAFEERARKDSETAPAEGYYEEFIGNPPFRGPARHWIEAGGGLLAADSPRLAFEMVEMFQAAGVPQLVAGYLGEAAPFSVHKTTFRRVEPSAQGAWHQDGSFMGEVHALNLWLSLSHCGDDAPGLDIVPRRLDQLVATGTEGTYVKDEVSQATAEAAAGDLPIVRPIFEPGDAVLFDDRCLHKTAADPSMPNRRFAIESWFFGTSAFPTQYAPMAI